jgi:nucleotide-binding universal stress UspA family protein
MGTTGASGLKEVFLGSNAAKVIKSAPCPVISVPESCEITAPLKICLSVDYQEPVAKNSLKTLNYMSQTFGSFIEIVYVYADKNDLKNKEKIEQTLYESLEQQKSAFNYIETKKEVWEAILDFIEEKNCTLLAIPMQKRNFFKALFHQSVSSKLAMKVNVPMLTLPYKD